MGAVMNTHRKATGRLDAALAKEPARTVKRSTRHAAARFILPIDDRYRLTADEHAWRIERRKGGHWRAIEWYSSIESAVNGLGRKRVRTSQVASLADALGAIDRVACTLRDALQPHFTVERR